MSCRNIQTRLHDYIEQALSEPQRGEVEAHLDKCPQCRQALSDTKASIALTQDLDEVDPPPFLATRIMAEVRATAQKRSWLGRLFLTPVRIPAGALAAVLILLISLQIYTIWMLGDDKDHPPLISDNTPGRLPEDPTIPDDFHSPGEALVNHPLINTMNQRPPDVRITLGVQAIDPIAKDVLRRLIEIDARISNIISSEGEYRIFVEINTADKQDLIQFLERIDKDMEVIGGLKSNDGNLLSITLVRRTAKP